MKYRINTYKASDMVVEAEGFSLLENVLMFFDEKGDYIAVIKDWSAFIMCDEEEKKNLNPDEFYDSLKEDRT